MASSFSIFAHFQKILFIGNSSKNVEILSSVFLLFFFSFFYSSSSEIILPFLKVSFTARVTCRFIYIQTYRVHKIQMFFFKQVLLCTTRGLSLLFVIFVFMSKTKTTERRSVGGCGPLLVPTV